MAFFITNQKENLYISQENFSKQAIGHGINNNVTDDHSIDTLTSIVIRSFCSTFTTDTSSRKGRTMKNATTETTWMLVKLLFLDCKLC